ncbi:MAG TPA: hypothetical protein VE377_06740 [Candidatus Dormibacteraeota bacterium]|nr:hypothetical protein [Candidatus Dormibacteraeota bacterium]
MAELAGLLVAFLLIASLILVQLSRRSQPLSAARPLDVDSGLPLPEIGQASTVFSLTALFGAYFGVYLVLGLPALCGLGVGTVIGLLMVRGWIRKQGSTTFEEFLVNMLRGDDTNASAFAFTVSGVQFAYAASELLILHEVCRVCLGIRSDQATLVTICVAIVGYFYVLFGGYLAVYRTDIIQFVFVAAMAISFANQAAHQSVVDWSRVLAPRHGYWEPPFGATGVGYLRLTYQFLVAVVMGAGFIASAPDAWKRAFVVARYRKKSLSRFVLFVAVGIFPFLVLIPFAMTTPVLPDGIVNLRQMFAGLLVNSAVFIAASTGLIASFLSAFDSAVLAGVHVSVIQRRLEKTVAIEVPRFYWRMVTALLTAFLVFQVFTLLGNPYLLANLLLGPVAIIAGVQAGSAAQPAHLRPKSLIWVISLALLAWFLYFISAVNRPTVPTTYQINTIPFGALLCLIVALIAYLLKDRGNPHAGIR